MQLIISAMFYTVFFPFAPWWKWLGLLGRENLIKLTTLSCHNIAFSLFRFETSPVEVNLFFYTSKLSGYVITGTRSIFGAQIVLANSHCFYKIGLKLQVLLNDCRLSPIKKLRHQIYIHTSDIDQIKNVVYHELVA